MYIYAQINTHTYIHTHIYTHIYRYVKLFVICLEIPHTQMPHHLETSHMDCGKSQKCETLEQGIPEQNPVLKVNKSELK